MHIRVLEAIDVVHRLDHRARLLGGGRVVEIDERLAVDVAVEDREIGTDALDVVGVANGRGRAGRRALQFLGVVRSDCHHALVAGGRSSSHSRARLINASRTSSRSTFPIASPINDSISSARASRSGMPRERQ